MFTQLNQYRVVPRGQARFPPERGILRDIYVTGTAGGQPIACRSTPLIRAYPTTAPLVVSRQGQFPAVTLSFNLAPGQPSAMRLRRWRR